MTDAVALDRTVLSVETSDPSTEAAAGACIDWLLRVDPALLAVEPRCAVEAVALASLAGRLAPSRMAEAAGFARRIAGDLPPNVWPRCDLVLALVAALALIDRAPSAPGASDYLRALSEIDPSAAAAASGALLDLAFDGEAEAPADLAMAPDLVHDRAEATAAFLGRAERATLLGTRSVRVAPVVPILVEGAAMACLRRYDLLLGMRLLRAANALRTDRSMGLEAGLAFVRALQRGDGGFGDFEAETPRPGVPPAIARWRLDLTVAFSALWTLAELAQPGFRPVAALLRDGGRRWSGRC